MYDKIDQAFEFLADVLLYSCVTIAALVGVAIPIAMVMESQEARSTHVIKFENFCDPEWKALEQYGARVNCYQE